MTLNEIKVILNGIERMEIQLPDGSLVPRHFHVTEVGQIHKRFVDCGGTMREEYKASFQLWEANDYDHRLHPEKLSAIIEKAQNMLDMPDREIEVEYQGSTIGRYDIDWDGQRFLLLSKTTDCLARDKCGVQEDSSFFDLTSHTKNSCAPGSGCC